ncbi:RDD family protein [Coraliomargarita sp. SDUM461004]|uniref:RDD family protein n=1 Tax=Thalassobacterium sedimentorum TaxID=3041258 RepID=A0ABU1AGR2_9BACT|nr:RDD family protein [Coraliomargarita sp. SDUM461004]MDQ8193978.1 RDD family protein [Coraliomargarita sp. SDUM461004]
MSSPNPNERPPENTPSTAPSAGNLLDSIFRKDGPMPTASIPLRAFAFLLDFILISAVASVIIWKIVLPQSHPAAFTELTDWTQSLITWYSERATEPDTPKQAIPEPSKNLTRALAVANELQMLTFWIYFALGEAFFGGSSLGKRICRIRSVSTVTLSPPPIMSGIVRGGLKTLTLYLLFPFGMIATLAALLFNKRRQMGHDMMSRTAVIDEKLINTHNSK